MKPPPQRRSRQGLAVSDAFRAFVLDQLADLGGVSARSMFGGVGLYAGDVFFGIIARDTLYLRVSNATRGDYDAAGMAPFAPFPGRRSSMRYYAVPLEVLESSVELVRWARKAVGAAAAPAPAVRGSRVQRKRPDG
jgi:DNA transformation protein and related proteins